MAVLAVIALAVVGCGGGADKKPVDSGAVEDELVAILNTCISKSYDQIGGKPADTTEMSNHVTRLIQQFKRDPEGKLKGVGIKAKTTRGAMERASAVLADCDQRNQSRVDNALTSN